MVAMKDCIFCTIANGDPSKLIWHNDFFAAFMDINPRAKVHVLVVPKKHVEKLDDLTDPVLAGQMIRAIQVVARQEGIAEGYRAVTSNGRLAGQEVDHLHFHILSGSSDSFGL